MGDSAVILGMSKELGYIGGLGNPISIYSFVRNLSLQQIIPSFGVRSYNPIIQENPRFQEKSILLISYLP